MADKYTGFAQLAADPANVPGWDYSYAMTDRRSNVVIVAPHGGGIEPGTSELATAIAGNDHSIFLFEGLKPSGNFAEFHITSTLFDAPGCRPLIQNARSALAIHGEDSVAPAVFVSGGNCALVTDSTVALLRAGYAAGKHSDPKMQGESLSNTCNLARNTSAQLEISKGLRRLFFGSLKRQGRQQPTPLFRDFVVAVRSRLQVWPSLDNFCQT